MKMIFSLLLALQVSFAFSNDFPEKEKSYLIPYQLRKTLSKNQQISVGKDVLLLLTKEDYDKLPIGFILYDINGNEIIKTETTKPRTYAAEYLNAGIKQSVFLKQRDLSAMKDKDIWDSWNLSARTKTGIKEFVESKKNTTWIWYDTETTGLWGDQAQLTEIYAIATTAEFNGDEINFKEVKSFHRVVKLSRQTLAVIKEQKAVLAKGQKLLDSDGKETKSIEEILKMTRYDKNSKDLAYEVDTMKDLISFIKSFKKNGDVMTIAHNARFDEDMIMNRALANGLVPSDHLAFDTKMFLKHFWLPLVMHLADKGDAKMIKMKEDLKTEMDWRPGNYYYTVSLGPVSNALGIKFDEWHRADADTLQVLEVFKATYNQMMTTSYTTNSLKKYMPKWHQ